MELRTRRQGLAARYAHDPDALRAEILGLTDGDEHVVPLIRAATASDDGRRDASDGGDNGQVIDFERSDDRNQEEDDEPPR